MLNNSIEILNHSKVQLHWQQNLQKFFDSDKYHDVVFIVGNSPAQQKRFYGHRILFAMHSEYFEKMLFDEQQPQKSSVIYTVCESDIAPATFELLKKYFYGLKDENFFLNENNVTDILYASQKYLLTQLKEICKQYLDNIINVNNILALYSRCTVLNLQNMDQYFKTKFNDFLANGRSEGNHEKLLKSDGFLQLRPDMIIEMFLENDEFNVEEEHLWERCIEYCKSHHSITSNNVEFDDSGVGKASSLLPSMAENEVNNNNDINEQAQQNLITMEACKNNWKEIMVLFVPHFRFRWMNSEFFAKNIVDSQLLTKEQEFAICLHYLDNERQVPFNNQQRNSHAKLLKYDLSMSSTFVGPSNTYEALIDVISNDGAGTLGATDSWIQASFQTPKTVKYIILQPPSTTMKGQWGPQYLNDRWMQIYHANQWKNFIKLQNLKEDKCYKYEKKVETTAIRIYSGDLHYVGIRTLRIYGY